LAILAPLAQQAHISYTNPLTIMAGKAVALDLEATKTLRASPPKTGRIKYHCNCDQFIKGASPCKTPQGSIKGFTREDTYAKHMLEHSLVIKFDNTDDELLEPVQAPTKSAKPVKPAEPTKQAKVAPKPVAKFAHFPSEFAKSMKEVMQSASEDDHSEEEGAGEVGELRAEVEELRDMIALLTVQVQTLVKASIMPTQRKTKTPVRIPTPEQSEDEAGEDPQMDHHEQYDYGVFKAFPVRQSAAKAEPVKAARSVKVSV
jgi:hypothetical protein